MWATQTSDLGPTGKSLQNKQDLGEQFLRAAAALRKLAKGLNQLLPTYFLLSAQSK